MTPKKTIDSESIVTPSTSAGSKANLLFDCTHVFNCSWMNSGIQRVVRNVAKELPRQWCGQECIPVTFAGGKFHRVRHLLPDDPVSRSVPARFVAWLQDLNDHLWNRYSQSEKAHLGLLEKAKQAVLITTCHAIYRPLLLSKWLTKSFGYDTFQSRTLPLETTENDSLVLLDSSWQVAGLREHVESLKQGGVRVTTIVYDIIPISTPEYCTTHLVEVFEEWFEWACRWTDGFACISRSVCEDLRKEVERRIGAQAAGRRTYGYFHLGSELDLKDATEAKDKALDAAFSGSQPVFLAVSTIEPRKNHDYLVDVFEMVWAAGSKAKLCIVGRVGWKCDDFMERATKHPQLGKNLFMFNSLNDNGLEYAYSKASALIFPSFAEGFGLPLVEAMQRGLPAIASDLPVFREVGGDYLCYCDPHDPKICAAIISEFERTGKLPGAKPLDDWKWIGWKESTIQLLEAVSGKQPGVN
jgi:glycosyltransferase involved in cell wall biosynthesis